MKMVSHYRKIHEMYVSAVRDFFNRLRHHAERFFSEVILCLHSKMLYHGRGLEMCNKKEKSGSVNIINKYLMPPISSVVDVVILAFGKFSSSHGTIIEAGHWVSSFLVGIRLRERWGMASFRCETDLVQIHG